MHLKITIYLVLISIGLINVTLGSSLSAEKKRVNWFRDFYLAKHEKSHIELHHLDENIFNFLQHNRALLFRDLLNGVNLMSETLTNVTSTLYGNANKGKCLPRFNRMMPTCRLAAELDENAPQYQRQAHRLLGRYWSILNFWQQTEKLPINVRSSLIKSFKQVASHLVWFLDLNRSVGLEAASSYKCDDNNTSLAMESSSNLTFWLVYCNLRQLIDDTPKLAQNIYNSTQH